MTIWNSTYFTNLFSSIFQLSFFIRNKNNEYMYIKVKYRDRGKRNLNILHTPSPRTFQRSHARPRDSVKIFKPVSYWVTNGKFFEYLEASKSSKTPIRDFNTKPYILHLYSIQLTPLGAFQWPIIISNSIKMTRIERDV